MQQRIGHSLWQQRFGADPGVLGREILVDGRRYEVIGVGPEGMVSPDTPGLLELAVPALENRNERGFQAYTAVGRIRDGAGLPQVQLELDAFAGNMVEAHYSCVTGHVMNDSYRLGEKVPFNAKAGRFGDNADAAEHFLKLHELMRDGVGVPEDKAEYTVGPWLTFDPKSETFTGEHAGDANKLVKDANNKEFEVPDVKKV